MSTEFTALQINIATMLAKQEETNRRLTKVEESLEDKFVTKDEHLGLRTRVTDLEENIRWVIRLLLSALLTGGLSLLAVLLKGKLL